MLNGPIRGAVLNRIGGFLEEKRRFTVRVATHLTGMRRVVATDAVDTPHRKYLIGSHNRNGRAWLDGNSKNCGHGASSLSNSLLNHPSIALQHT
jgi:hypothetical protein